MAHKKKNLAQTQRYTTAPNFSDYTTYKDMQKTHIDAKTEHQTQKSKYIHDLTDKEVTET